MTNVLKSVNTKNTPQTTKARGDQVENSAGGFVFTVSDKDRLERFLILGTDGGTYYISEQKLTDKNVEFLRDLIRRDEDLVRNVTVDVSENGRAFRNSTALFVMALLFVEGQNKAASRAALPKVARTSTHLFEFAQYIENLGGWGRAKRGAVADWYESKTLDQLAYQMVKYRQRDGWKHSDLLRLSHPKNVDENLANFALGKPHGDTAAIIAGFEQMQAAGSVKEVLSTLDEYKNLPWETIPTEFLTDRKVWRTLFYNGQLNGQALVRNITRLARIKAFGDMKFAADYAARLTDEAMIAKSRLHPINYLNASVVYTTGQVDRKNGWYGWARNKNWDTSPIIADALNDGFYAAFKAVEPANKRTMLALDISGSMSSNALGLDLSCAQVSAAMAMTVARTEPMYVIKGFSTSLIDLNISSRTRLDTALREVSNRTFGGTNCAAPMQWALKNDVEIDHFCVITDNETWAGKIHPSQALEKYRNSTGIDAKVSVLGVASTGFTIADGGPNMMDFVGFDSNAPRALTEFAAGRI